MIKLLEMQKKINEHIWIEDLDFIKEMINLAIDDLNIFSGGKEINLLLDFSETNEIKLPDYVFFIKEIFINAFKLKYIDYASFLILKAMKNKTYYNNFDDFYYTKKTDNSILIFERLPNEIKNNAYAVVTINYPKMIDDTIIDLPDKYNPFILNSVLLKIFSNSKYYDKEQISFFSNKENYLVNAIINSNKVEGSNYVN